jgi:hypothetical protein
MRRRWSGLPRGHSRSNLRKRNARGISTPRWSVVCIVADQCVGVGVARRRNRSLLALTQRLAPNAVARYPSAPYALGCDYCATACRDLIVGWTYSTQNELASLSSLCAVKRRAGYVVLCKLLSGSIHRLRATSKVGEFTRGSNLLAMFGASLAPACRASTGTGWCLGQLERRSKGIELPFFRLRPGTRNNTRQDQCGRAKPISRARVRSRLRARPSKSCRPLRPAPPGAPVPSPFPRRRSSSALSGRTSGIRSGRPRR